MATVRADPEDDDYCPRKTVLRELRAAIGRNRRETGYQRRETY
jgi:hypothetical protein